MPDIQLRKVKNTDLDTYFEFQLDPQFNHMAAFTSKYPNDREAFDQHWEKIMSNPDIPISTIEVDGEIVGSVLSYVMFEERQIAFSIGRQFWGQGYATKGVRLYLVKITERPMFGRAAFDNVGSIKVLEKCGFVHTGDDKYFANARGEEITEVIYKLEG